MRPIFFLSLHIVIAAALLWMSGERAIGQSSGKPYVVLVSIDGFRFDYAERFKARNILAIRDNGAAAASMIPSFPSVTFPNHVAIVTGLYPEHHGIVGNSFFDPSSRKEFRMKTNGADGSWYEQGTPLWVLAEQQHVIAGCMLWPTCDAEIRGVRPTYWRKFDGGVSEEKRVDQVIEWLKLPEERRPHFVALYFGEVDAAGHQFGPESLQTAEAVLEADRMIGRLRAGLDRLKLSVNLILVSDHGMQDVQDGQISLASEADDPGVRIELEGPLAFIYCKDSTTTEKTYLRLKKNSRLDVYRTAETPPSWHFNQNPRGGDLVAIVKGSAVFTLRNINPGRISADPLRGEHGYDPRKFITMGAIFYAIGPNIRPETRLAPFENVAVYPFIAKVLGLQTPENLDGTAGVLSAVIQAD